MEAILLGRRAYVEERYRLIEAARQRQGRIAHKERAGGHEGCVGDGVQNRRDGWDQENDVDFSQDILAEVVEAANAHRSRRPVTYARKKEAVLGTIMHSLYSDSEAQVLGAEISDQAQRSGSAAAVGTSCVTVSKLLEPQTSPSSLNDLDMPTQFALRMFFRLCRSLGDPERLPGNTRLIVQVAHRLPAILVSVPSCVLAPGFSDTDSVGESGDILSVFNEFFELFGRLLELPTGGSSSSRGGRQLESGVTLPAVSTSEHGCLSCTDRATVTIAYLALSLKMGRLYYLLAALQYLIKCEPDTITAAHFEVLGPLFEGLATARAEFAQEAPDRENSVTGFLMSFGKGDHGKLGHGQCTHAGCQDGNCTENKAFPTMIEATRDIKFAKIDSLSTHSIGITTAGEIMAWGNGDKYRLGHGSTSKEYVPRVIEALAAKGRVRDISCGLGHTLALMDSGELYAWGNGSNGRLGLGDTLDRSNPTMVPPASIISARTYGGGSGTLRLRTIYCGASHSMAISWDGKLFCWGKNNQGQCGHGHSNDQLVVQEVAFSAEESEDTVVSAAGGWEHSLFCTSSGRVFACGCGYKDSRRTGVPPVLGLGDYDRRLKPALVAALADAKEEIAKVACGWDHSIAISISGQVFTWGSGANGKLGHGDEESCDLPTLVKEMDGKAVLDAKAGCEHTVLLTANHEVWTFGHGDSGRLGHGDSQTRKTPTRIEQFSQSKMKPVAIAAGDKYNLLLVDECETEEHSSHEPIVRWVSNKRRRNGGHECSYDTILSERYDVASGGSHVAVDDSSTSAHHSRNFQSDWVLSLIEPDSSVKVVGSPRCKTQTLPETVRSVVLFVLGHIDRVAAEYRRADCDEERDEPRFMLATEAIMPFAIDTSTEAVRALSELLVSSVSALHELALTQAITTSNTKQSASLSCHDMLTQDRTAVVLSLLRILQLNISRITALKLQSTVDEMQYSSGNDQLIKGIYGLVSGIARLDDDKLVHILRDEDDDNQLNGGSQCLLAVRHEAAMVLKAGFGLFYPDSQERTRLLTEIISTTKSGDISSTWIAVLANCLYQDEVIKPLFHALLNPSVACDLPSMLLSLLELCTKQAEECGKRGASICSGESGDDWPSRMLQVMLMHWLGLVNQLLNRLQMSETSHMVSTWDSHPVSGAIGAMLKFLPEFMERLLAFVKKLHRAICQEGVAYLLGLNGASVCTLLPSIVECLCFILRRSDGKKCGGLSIRLVLVERLLPTLRATLSLLDGVVCKVRQPQEHANDRDNENQGSRGYTSPIQRDELADGHWLAELSGSCCSLFGLLCAEVLCEDSALNDTANFSEGDVLRIKRIIQWNKRGQPEIQNDKSSVDVGEQEAETPLLAKDECDFGSNNLAQALSSTALLEVITTLRTLVTDSAKLALLSEITGVFLTESKKNRDRAPLLNQSVSDFYMSVVTLLDDRCHSTELVEEALAIWCVPLTALGASSEKAADTISKAGVVELLQRILLRHQEVLQTRPDPDHSRTVDASHCHEAMYSPNQDVSHISVQSALPPKLKQALFPLFGMTSNFEGVGALAWEALCSVAVQLAQTKHFRRLGATLFLHNGESPLLHTENMESKKLQSLGRRNELHKASVVATVNQSIEGLLDTLFLLLQHAFEAQEQLRTSSRHLASLLTASAMPMTLQTNASRWRQQSKAFLLANPVVASAARRQVVGLTRAVMPLRTAVDNDGTTEGQTDEPKRLSISLWLYANEFRPQLSSATKSSLEQPSSADGIRLPPESICLVAVGGASFQVSGGISNIPDAKSPAMILAATPANDRSITLSLITSSTCGGDVAWNCAKLGGSISVASWYHLVLVVSSAGGGLVQVFINGDKVDVPDKAFQFDEDYFDEACNWSTVHIGGQMHGLASTLPVSNGAQGEPHEGPSTSTTELSVVLDDVWMIGREIPVESIEQLYLGGSMLFQAKRQVLLEDRCLDLMRLLHAMVTACADTIPAINPSETLCSDRWITLLIRLHGSCVQTGNSAAVVYLSEILSQLLPMTPASSTVDLLGLGGTCFSQFVLDSGSEDVSPVRMLFQLDGDGSRPQHDDLPSSKRRELLHVIKRRRSLARFSAGEPERHTVDKRSGHGEEESFVSKAGVTTVAYAAGLRLFHKIAAAPRWTPWMEHLVEHLISDHSPTASSSNCAQICSPLHVVVAILSGYPAPLFQAKLGGTNSCAALPSRILSRWSDAILHPSIKSSRLNGAVVAAIQKLLVALLGSTELQTAQIQQLRNASSTALDPQLGVQAGVITMINLRTRLLRFIASQLCDGDDTAPRWRTLLVANPTICRFLLQIASVPVVSFVKTVLGLELEVSSKHLGGVHGFVTLLQDTNRRAGRTGQLHVELEALQWHAWSTLHTQKGAVQDMLLSLSPESSSKAPSPLAVVAGKVDLCGLQAYAREGFPTVKLPTSTICANSGLWFYEVVLLTNGLMQIGFLDGDFSADPAQGQGVGDHASSWAFDGYRCKKWNVRSQDYGERWHVNDVVGVLLDTDRMEVSFFLNGKFLGVAFAAPAVATNSPMFPAASLNVCQAVEFIVGPSKEAITGARTIADRHQLYQKSFRYWPVLGSQQDQRRLKPVIAATTTITTAQQTVCYGTPRSIEARQPCSDDGDSVDDDSDIDHDYGALRANSSFLGVDEADTTSEGAATERATVYEVHRQPVRSRDSQDRRLAEPSNDARTIDIEKDEESNRQRELVDGLTALGIPFEWALRCALETNFTISESGCVSWVLEQMEKQAANTGGWLRPANAGSDVDDTEIRWPSQASVQAVGASRSTGIIDGLARVDGSTRSINSVEDGDRQHNAQNDNAQDDHSSWYHYNVIPPSLLAAPTSSEPKYSTTSIVVDTREEPPDLPSEYFASEFVWQGVQDGLFDSLLPRLQRTTMSQVEPTPDKSAQHSEEETSLLPLCIAVDAALSVNYSRLAMKSLFKTTGETSGVAKSKLYQLIAGWITDGAAAIELFRFIRIAMGLDQSEPWFDGGSFAFLGDCKSSPSLQLEQAMISLLEEELQEASDGTTTTNVSLDASATSAFPLFGLLFESMQQQCRRVVAATKGFSRKQENTGDATEQASLTLDAAWFAWLAGIVYSHTERVSRNERRCISASTTRFAQTVSSTCYSLAFFNQLATIALVPTTSSVMQWKYVAIKLLTRICSALKNCDDVQVVAQHKSSPPDSSSSSGAECGQFTWFSDDAEAFHAALPVKALVELFTLRFRRENGNRVFASEITSAILELLVYLSRPERLPQLMETISDASPSYELFVDSLSSTHISLSWRHGPSDSSNTTTATTRDGTGSTAHSACDHSGASIVALHVEAIRSGFTKIASAEEESEASPRVQPCQGTTTLRNLAPDTTYRVRLMQVNTDESCSTQDDNVEVRGSNMTAAILNELMVQTPPEPPFELDPINAGKNLVVLSQNLTVKNAVNKKWHSVRGSVGFDEGVHQWQVRIDVCVSKNIFIGVCTAQASLDNYIGSDAFGYGFLANKAIWNNKTKLHSYGEIFKQGDLIRVTLDCNAKTLAFSRNGESLGVAATNLRPGADRGADATTCKWFPAFSLYNKDDQLTLIPPVASSGSSIAGSRRAASQYSSVDESVIAVRRLLSYEHGIHAVPQSEESSTDIKGALQSFEDAYQFFKKWRMGSTIVREIGLGRVIFIDSSRRATEKYGLHTGDTIFTSQGHCVVLGESQHLLWYEVDSTSSFEACYRSQRDCKTEVAAWSRSYCLDMLKNSDEFPIHRYRDDIEKERLNSGDLASDVTAEQFRKCQCLWSRSGKALKWDSKLVNALDSLALAQSASSPLCLSFKSIATALQGDTLSLSQFQAHFGVCSERSGGGHNPVSCLLVRVAFLITLNAAVYRAARFVLPRNHFARSFPGTPTPSQVSATATDLQPGHEGAMATVTLASTLSSPLWTASSSSDGTVSSQTMRTVMAGVLFRSHKEQLMSEDLGQSKTISPVAPVPTSVDELDTAPPTPTATDLPVVSVSYPTRARVPCFWELLRTNSSTSEYLERWLLPKSSHAMTTIFAQLSKQLELRRAVDWRREVTRAFDALPIRQAFVVSVSNLLEARRYAAGEGDGSSLCSTDLEQAHDGSSGNEADESVPPSVEADLSVEYLQLLECAAKEIQSPGFPLFSPTPPMEQNLDPVLQSNPTPRKVMLDINTSLFMPVIVRDECNCYYPTRSELLGWFFRVGQLLGIAWRSRALLPLQFLSMAFWGELVDPTGQTAQDTPQTSEEQIESRTNDDNDEEREFGARARQEAIDAVRDGLLSIIPSRCLMLCGSSEELRARLSDLDVQFVSALHSRAVYDKENRHHRLFWKVVREFSATERKLLVKFITTGGSTAHEVEGEAGAGELVLELSDALHDGRDRPDTCYPVMTVVDIRTRRLHLPEYSSATALRTKLTLAMTNLPLG